MPRPPESSLPDRPIAAHASCPEAPIALPRVEPAAEHARALLEECGLEVGTSRDSTFASAALEWATCGAMALTGDPEDPPGFVGGPLATAARGAGLALSALAPGSRLEQIDTPALLGERAALLGLTRRGQISAGGSARLLRTRDGWLAVNLPRDDDWSLVPAWLEHGELSPEARDWKEVGRALERLATASVLDRGRLMGLAVAEAAREPGKCRPWLRVSHETARAEPRPPRPVRLLDLSHLWAGPLAASLLGMSGFEVLKVENPTRPDGARNGPKAFFDLLNGEKLGCALDLQNARERTRFEALLEQADVVLESARPRALEQLGIDAASWVRAKPGRIWASITGYGREAGKRDWIAFGDDAAVAAGLAWPADRVSHDGKAWDAPRFCADAIADPLTGLHAAVAILGHWHADRGGLLDLSLVDVTSRAACLPVETLTLPIEYGSRGWSVVEHGRSIPIEAPRARPVTAEAPPLAPPRDTLWASEPPPC